MDDHNSLLFLTNGHQLISNRQLPLKLLKDIVKYVMLNLSFPKQYSHAKLSSEESFMAAIKSERTIPFHTDYGEVIYLMDLFINLIGHHLKKLGYKIHHHK